jgi:hypothetical protein
MALSPPHAKSSAVIRNATIEYLAATTAKTLRKAKQTV